MATLPENDKPNDAARNNGKTSPCSRTPLPVRLARLGAAALRVAALCTAPAFAAGREEDPNQAKRAENLSETLRWQDKERTYYIHLPPAFSKDNPAPLVLALHGGGGSARRFDRGATNGTLSEAADKRGVVLVFPEGMDGHWFDGRTEIFRGKRSYDDAGFISRIIDRMVAGYGIDPGRVYATGISNGGFMSVRLAMDLSDRIAAVAPVTAQLAVALRDRTPALPVSVMLVNGTADPLVPFDGGHIRLFRFGRSRGEILSTAATIERFRRHNGCAQQPEAIRIEDRDPNDGARAEVHTYGGGKDGTEVVLVKIVGGGHTWPGGTQYLRSRLVGRVCRDFNASERILDFFLKHARPTARTRGTPGATEGSAP